MFNIIYNYMYYYASMLFKPIHTKHPTLKNKYFITYNFEGKNYNLLVSKQKGPHKIISIYGNKSDESPCDIYDYVLQFMGPNMDFHNIEYTPNCIGLDRITFDILDKEQKTFEKNQVIKL